MRRSLSNVARWLTQGCAAGLLIAATAASASAQIVISQVYGAGGNAGAVLQNDYVELFNRGAAPASLAGLSVQYASATGTGNFSQVRTLSGSLAPGQYYLVQMAGGAAGAALPTPDVIGTAAMAAGAGKVVLVNSTAALACNGNSTPCTPAQAALIIDLVGYGGANFFEGTGGTPAISTTIAAFRGSNGCTDTNNNATDFSTGTPAPRNSASTLAPCSGSSTPTLSINDVSLAEGNSGTVTATFTVTANPAAGAGGITFDIATADNTATTAGNDYVGQALTSQTIPASSTTYTFAVTVNGDTASEPNETFFVNITNAVGANVGDGQGQGTIQNDDVTLTPISSVQGSGNLSPLAATTVIVQGVVTGRRTNGFYIQTVPGAEDADPATSEGVFVFTSSAPPAAAVVGNVVNVAATVAEFGSQYTVTELTSPTVLLISTGNPLPAPVTLTAGDFTATYGLEKYEGMRVVAASLTVVAPTDGNVAEASATSTSTGVFYGVLTGTARPFKEAGISVFVPVDPTWPATLPRFDSNPERLRVDDSLTGATALNVSTGAVLTNVVGILDNGFTEYTLLLDPTNTPGVSAGQGVVPVPSARPEEVTVASLNLERFFDAVNDSNGAPTLTPTAVTNRLNKASLTIRDLLKTPDILATVEVEHLTILQALADKVNSDAVTAGAPNPGYLPFLFEGNDVGGIDVGFLVRNTVQTTSVTQVGLTTTFIDPSDGSVDILNDRPPVHLRATVTSASGSQMALSVIVNHLRSLGGVETLDATGTRVRAKRRAQAEFLASYVQGLQTATPSEKIVLVGDFNAFEVNDGYVDVMGTIVGAPSPASQVVLASADLVTPDLVNLTTFVPPADRYSYSFEGSAQVLDHVLVSQNLANFVSRISHGRSNADQPETERGNPNSPARLSDHDGVVVAFATGAPRLVAQVIAKSFSGTTATVDVRFTNTGTGNVLSAMVNAVTFRTMAGTGTVSLGDALPLSLGVIAPGQSVVRTLTLSVPTTVTRFTMTEIVNFTSAAGDALRLSSTQTVAR